jgi:UDP-N-acetylmuramate--alanine ligase
MKTMNLNKINKMYFLGIGGIGMSALARYFKNEGKQIYGYDLTSTPLTRQLEAEGMEIHYEEDLSKIPRDIDLVVLTPAVPAENAELIYFIENETPMIKRAQLIGQLSHNYFTIAVAGTHGKTSISAIAAHLLKSAGLNLTAFVGGICRNYQSNLVLSEKTDYLLVEADEFDRSFLNLQPDISVISSMDADHLDIYGSKEELVKTFKEFAGLLSKEGIFIHNKSLPAFNLSGIQTITYGILPKAGVRAVNIHIRNGKFLFDLETENQKIDGITMQIPGYHYIENALAAASIGLQLGLSGEQIKSGLESFAGVERRFEIRINQANRVYIDDYAHHPEEIKATISAAKMLHPGKKITVVFQPHLFSRTKDFADGFATALSEADQLILLDIYPAREKPIPGVTSDIILSKTKNTIKQILSKNELTEFLRKNKPELLLTMGAGDIGLMTKEIEKALHA